MANVYLAKLNYQDDHWLDYPRNRLIDSYKTDTYNCHHIVENLEKADVILYATNYKFSFAGLGI
jgi:hypothetical protein